MSEHRSSERKVTGMSSGREFIARRKPAKNILNFEIRPSRRAFLTTLLTLPFFAKLIPQRATLDLGICDTCGQAATNGAVDIRCTTTPFDTDDTFEPYGPLKRGCDAHPAQSITHYPTINHVQVNVYPHVLNPDGSISVYAVSHSSGRMALIHTYSPSGRPIPPLH